MPGAASAVTTPRAEARVPEVTSYRRIGRRATCFGGLVLGALLWGPCFGGPCLWSRICKVSRPTRAVKRPLFWTLQRGKGEPYRGRWRLQRRSARAKQGVTKNQGLFLGVPIRRIPFHWHLVWGSISGAQ